MSKTEPGQNSAACANCGETLVGQVNRCWKCGRDVVWERPESETDERVHPHGGGNPFANESLPLPSPSADETDYANEAMASTAGNAAILIGLSSLPFSRTFGIVALPALIGLSLACWCIAARRRKRRGILGVVICLLAIGLAGRLLYADFNAWYFDHLQYSRF